LQADVSGLVSQLQDLHKKNVELEEENKTLASRVRLRNYIYIFMYVVYDVQLRRLFGNEL
jgi:hypothetical protein